MKLPKREVIKDKLSRHILYKPELFLQEYAEGKLVRVKNKRNLDATVRDFIRGLQWDLRDSYNSSSCLSEKQVAFLEERLFDLLATRKSN